MRFGHYFERFKGVAGKTDDLNTDALPTSTTKIDIKTTNLYCPKFRDNAGYPASRLIVGYSGPLAMIDVAVYFYEEQSKSWYQIDLLKSVPTDRMVSFDIVCPVDPPATARNTGAANVGVGGLEILIIPIATLPPDGTYKFCASLDLSPGELGSAPGLVAPESGASVGSCPEPDPGASLTLR